MNKLNEEYIKIAKDNKTNFDIKVGFYEEQERWGPEKTDFIKGFFSFDQSWWDKTEKQIFTPEFDENYALAFLIGASLVASQVPEYDKRVQDLINKIIPETKIFTKIFKDFVKADAKDKYNIGLIAYSISGFKRKIHGTIEQWY